MNTQDIKIETLTPLDNPEIQRLLKGIYKKKSFNTFNVHLYNNLTDLFFKHPCSSYNKESIKAVYKNKIIGFIILIDVPIEWELDYTPPALENKNGLKSIIFAVDKKHQHKGIGTMILKYIEDNYKKDFDYIWGVQHIAISDVNFFKKRRTIVAEIDGAIYSVKTF